LGASAKGRMEGEWPLTVVPHTESEAQFPQSPPGSSMSGSPEKDALTIALGLPADGDEDANQKKESNNPVKVAAARGMAVPQLGT